MVFVRKHEPETRQPFVMQITINTETCLGDIRSIETEIERGNLDAALARYLGNYPRISGKVKIERKLAYLAVRLRTIGKYPSSWPAEMMKRISGAALVFAVSQVARVEIRLPAALKNPERIPSDYKRCFADAWEIRPECACLNDRDHLSRFAVCLATEKETAGPCLIAAASRNDAGSDLIEHLKKNWMERGLSGSQTPTYISKAMGIEKLKEVASLAVGRAVGHFWENGPALSKLQQIAFDLGKYDVAITCGEILLNTDSDAKNSDAKTQRGVLALRLASLVETNRNAEAVEEYAALWQPFDVGFPFPERLLYAFQKQGAWHQEKHLLETGVFTAHTPRWAVLSRDLLYNREIPKLVRKWAELYRTDSGDERVLVGFSKAVLSLPALQRGKLSAALSARWSNLSKYDAYTLTAGAFLVFLRETDEGRIDAYEKHLRDADLSHFMVGPAARLYIRALCRRKKWGRLRKYFAGTDAEAMLSVAPFEEYEFIRIMALVDKLPADGAELKEWCRHWERLIALPIKTDMLTEALGHFINLRKQLKSAGNVLADDDFLEDFTLQLLRRAKAEGEILIRTDGFPEDVRERLAARLKKSRLEGTLAILLELSPYYRHELETIRWHDRFG